MSAPKLPPLPEHRCLHTFVASASLGTVSVHGMHQDDVRAYGLACYQQAIEDAAKVCAEEAKKWKYPKYRYAAAAATHCEALIRRLKGTP